MRTNRGGLLALSALILVGANDIRAQDVTADRRPGMRRAANVEMIMSMRDRLELTDEQVAAMEEIRRESVALRNDRRAAIEEMRSRLRAGQIRRSELMALMEDLRAEAPDLAEQRRARIEGILDEAQLEALGEMRARGRAFMRGRASARRGPGPGRGARSQRPIRSHLRTSPTSYWPLVFPTWSR